MNANYSRKQPRRWLTVLWLVLVILAAGALPGAAMVAHSSIPSQASGMTFTVDSTVDAVDASPGDGACATTAGECTLRAAVQETNTRPGRDTIVLPAGTYILTLHGAHEDEAATGDLDITDDLVLEGGGPTTTVLDGDGDDRVLDIQNDADVEITGVTIRGGYLSDETGAGVYLRQGGGSLVLVDSLVTENYSNVGGGGISNGARLSIENSTVSMNSVDGYGAFGGGLYNAQTGLLRVTNSTISGNQAHSQDSVAHGGGIYNRGMTRIVNSTVMSNIAEAVTNGGNVFAKGGGIHSGWGAGLNVVNSTLSGNRANGVGGGIGYGGGVFAAGNIVINSSTLSDNFASDAGGGVFNITSVVRMRTTILAGNTAETGPDCGNGAGIISGGHNVVGVLAGCNFLPGPDDQLGVDPRLGPLQDNGGLTLTHALLEGSPAIDTLDQTDCKDDPDHIQTSDQRGFMRPVDGDSDGRVFCDSGAYEVGATGRPDFTLRATPLSQAICAATDALYDLQIGSFRNYADPVALSARGNPNGTSVTFDPSVVTPPGNSLLTIGDTSAAAPGRYFIDVLGIAPTSTHTVTVGLTVYNDRPAAPVPLSPSDGATHIPRRPLFDWSAVAQATIYHLEVAADPSFANIVYSATVSLSEYALPITLGPETTYYWRVYATNGCGIGNNSVIFNFTTVSDSYTVDSTVDATDANPGDGQCASAAGVCTLRAAIQEGNAIAGPSGEVVIMLPPGDYILTLPGADEDGAATGDLDVTGRLTIIRTGDEEAIIDGNSPTTRDRVFDVQPEATLALSSVTITSGRADNGGGIRNQGDLTVSNTLFTENISFGPRFAGGGGIYNTGRLVVNNSTFAENRATDRGAGIYNNSGTAIATISNSTFSGNEAGHGGGLFNASGALETANTTVWSNSALIDGGGIYNVSLSGATTTSRGTIWAGNTAGGNGPDCWGTITSEGYNLVGNRGGCTFQATTGDQTGTPGNPLDPLLGPLQDNGGPTWTHALLPGSPAVDTGDPNNCPLTDQRGYGRPVDGDGNGSAICDVGAYEVQ